MTNISPIGNASVLLNAAQRESLLSLRETTTLSDRTTLRLSTGRRINSAADDAVSFFRARSLSDRATDLASRRDNIGLGISSLNSALSGTSAIDSLLRQLRGIAESTRSQTETERTASTNLFSSVLTQINNIIGDTSFNGLNLLNATSNRLTINFSPDAASELVVNGADLNNSIATNQLFTIAGIFGAGGTPTTGADLFSRLGFAEAGSAGFSSIGASNSLIANVDTVVSRLDSAIANVQAQSSRLGINAAILETRLSFTNNYVNNLQQGADDLVNANLNEESANLLALQTRQQLSISSLSLASQQQQAILRLIQ